MVTFLSQKRSESIHVTHQIAGNSMLIMNIIMKNVLDFIWESKRHFSLSPQFSDRRKLGVITSENYHRLTAIMYFPTLWMSTLQKIILSLNPPRWYQNPSGSWTILYSVPSRTQQGECHCELRDDFWILFWWSTDQKTQIRKGRSWQIERALWTPSCRVVDINRE